MRRILFFSATFLAASLADSYCQTPGTLKWRLTMDGDVTYSSLALAPDGTLYVGRHNLAGGGSLWAIDTATVSTAGAGYPSPNSFARWQITFTNQDGALDTPAIAAGGTVYIGTDTNRVSALDPANGTNRWTFDDSQSQPYGIHGAPAIGKDGTVYVGIWENVYALTNAPGTTNLMPKWTFSYPSLDPDVVPNFGFGGFQYTLAGRRRRRDDLHQYRLRPAFCPESRGRFAQMGEYAARFSDYVGSGYSCSPAIGPDGTVYYGAADYFFAVDPASGNNRWSHKTLHLRRLSIKPRDWRRRHRLCRSIRIHQPPVRIQREWFSSMDKYSRKT